MDGTSETVNFLITPVAPYLRIFTVGLAGSSEVDYPKNADVIETFQSEHMMLHGYRQSSFAPVMKALAISHKTSLRMNRRGFMHLMFMIQLQSDNDEMLFVEYFVCNYFLSLFLLKQKKIIYMYSSPLPNKRKKTRLPPETGKVRPTQNLWRPIPDDRIMIQCKS